MRTAEGDGSGAADGEWSGAHAPLSVALSDTHATQTHAALTHAALTHTALSDAHATLVCDDNTAPFAALGGGAPELVVGTRPGDWAEVAACAARGGVVAAALGWHPWFLLEPRFSAAGVAQLEQALAADARLQVGECGLDHAFEPRGGPHPRRCARAAADASCPCQRCVREVQRAALGAQLALAARLGRCASLHCVRAHGALLDALAACDARWPPALNLHAWSGSPEVTRQLLRTPGLGPRLFFGTCAHVNLRSLALATWQRGADGRWRSGPALADKPWRLAAAPWAAFCARMLAIPPDRVLLESDLCARRPALGAEQGGRACARVAALELVAEVCADALQLDVRELQLAARRNLARFLAMAAPGATAPAAGPGRE
jgi:Tat protein secretion system quality control protein TatD with DNase activity